LNLDFATLEERFGVPAKKISEALTPVSVGQTNLLASESRVEQLEAVDESEGSIAPQTGGVSSEAQPTAVVDQDVQTSGDVERGNNDGNHSKSRRRRKKMDNFLAGQLADLAADLPPSDGQAPDVLESPENE
jgi:hypothetical protein